MNLSAVPECSVTYASLCVKRCICIKHVSLYRKWSANGFLTTFAGRSRGKKKVDLMQENGLNVI